MSNYTQTTFFTPKDTLPPTNPAKTIFGAAYDVEFGNIAIAIASKVDVATPQALVSVNVGSATGTTNTGDVNISGGFKINGVNIIQTGTFTGTLTGMTGTTTGTVSYRLTGGMVTLAFPAGMTGTSNSNALTMTGLPSILQPASLTQTVTCLVENGGSNSAGAATATAGSGTITFGVAIVSGSFVLLSSGSFTTSGAKGLNGTTFTYSL